VCSAVGTSVGIASEGFSVGSGVGSVEGFALHPIAHSIKIIRVEIDAFITATTTLVIAISLRMPRRPEEVQEKLYRF
jgi:hypothetical protein